MTLTRGRTTGRTGLGALTVAALAAAGTLAAGLPAYAATPATGVTAAPHLSAQTSFTIPPGVSAYRASAGSTQVTVTRSSSVSPTLAINCTVTAYNPFRYYGGLYGGGVEGLGSVSCTNVVNSIDLLVVLFKGTTAVASKETVRYNVLQSTVDTETPYSSGSYQTGAITTVVFPDNSSGTSDPAYSAVTYIP